MIKNNIFAKKNAICFFSVFGKDVIADRSPCTRSLEVDEVFARVHLPNHFVEKRLELFLGAGKLDLQKTGAVKKTVDVIVERKDLIVAAVGRIVDAVAEVACAVVHGDRHLLDPIVSSVVIAEIFHRCTKVLS